MPIYTATVASPLGLLRLAATDQGLAALWLPGKDAEGLEAWLDRTFPGEERLEAPDHPHLARAREQLAEYFAGGRDRFDLPLDLRGTPYQVRVWQALLEIPRGGWISYGALARMAGGSPRSVGGAVGANPVAVIVPCHRVLAAGGGLGGFSADIRHKERLLALEGVGQTKPG